jgi:hypothetical protein
MKTDRGSVNTGLGSVTKLISGRLLRQDFVLQSGGAIEHISALVWRADAASAVALLYPLLHSINCAFGNNF